MTEYIMLEHIGKAAKNAAYQLALLSGAEKNRALITIADALVHNQQTLLSENQQDIDEANRSGLSPAILDRLLLTPARLQAMADDVRQISTLRDPVGQIIGGGQLDNGLRIERRRVPLGVIGVIYEARPNVTIDVAALCLKTGNAAILRGGKETRRSNAALITVIRQALQQCELPAAAIQSIDNLQTGHWSANCCAWINTST